MVIVVSSLRLSLYSLYHRPGGLSRGFSKVFEKISCPLRTPTCALVHACLCFKTPDKISCDGRHFLLTMIVYHTLSYLSIDRLYKVSGKSLCSLPIDNLPRKCYNERLMRKTGRDTQERPAECIEKCRIVFQSCIFASS